MIKVNDTFRLQNVQQHIKIMWSTDQKHITYWLIWCKDGIVNLKKSQIKQIFTWKRYSQPCWGRPKICPCISLSIANSCQFFLIKRIISLVVILPVECDSTDSRSNYVLTNVIQQNQTHRTTERTVSEYTNDLRAKKETKTDSEVRTFPTIGLACFMVPFRIVLLENGR